MEHKNHNGVGAQIGVMAGVIGVAEDRAGEHKVGASGIGGI